jgi:hypothetical protein
MRVLIATPFRPSSDLGIEDLSRTLEHAMQEHGHEVDTIRIPFAPDPGAVWRQLLAFRLTDVSDVGELLVATGTPCHVLRHPRKVLWLTEYYPWIDESSATFDSFRVADNQACCESTAVFAVSQRICDRIARLSGRTVEPLVPPPEGEWDRVVAALTAAARTHLDENRRR